MNYLNYVGIDVSKEKLDIALLKGSSVEQSDVIENSSISIARWLKKWEKDGVFNQETTLFCLEPTGHYSNTAIAVLLQFNLNVWVANPSDIRHSIGMQRGKNDKVDAVRIAQYAYRFRDKARLAKPSEAEGQELKQLLVQRELLVADKAKYATQITEFRNRISAIAYKVMERNNKRIVKELEKAIEYTEAQIQKLIDSLPQLKQQYELLQSVTGVGKVLAQTLLAFTNGFDRFDTPRALACHAGVAPFSYTSGTSIRSRNKVSHRANKRLKTLLHLAALSSIRYNGELKTYYERKVAEGKSKMTVLNAVRNKIIHRIFAVIKRNTPYKALELS